MSKVVKNGQKWSKNRQYCQKRLKMDNNFQKWSKMVNNDQYGQKRSKLSKMIKTDRKKRGEKRL